MKTTMTFIVVTMILYATGCMQNSSKTTSAKEAATIVMHDLVSHIDDDSAAPKLMLIINRTPHRGEIEHDHASHDHGDHDH